MHILAGIRERYGGGCTRVLHPLRFFKLEDTAGIIIALVSALMTPSSILSGDSFYADMRIFNEILRQRANGCGPLWRRFEYCTDSRKERAGQEDDALLIVTHGLTMRLMLMRYVCCVPSSMLRFLLTR